ncbi:CitMHS family transporter [Noviherbaspirillum saxi]|uniref:Citrate:proton symporter n=1 Tax=Noviherbaspirillum saxi TaxID=2320863 RepID=A0A3A3FJK1_9BURK|nr:citrate:proton symporter [Noviherbaspirillum saxi]RJF95477.1 citrate:proton symporter [Noviherbaspirillum saxi]
MLVVLGFGMITAFMYLIMTKRLTPVAALIIVPILFGLAAGGGLDLGKSIVDSIKTVAPTACLLFFAIIFFGVMIDVGMFDPLIKLILKFVHHDPVRLVIGTALLTTIVSLDGDGSTTFIIVTSAFLPIYLRLGMNPWVLTCVAATANGILNTVPWGGSTARAAAALKLNPVDIFMPMIPAVAASIAALLAFAYLLGRAERKRIGQLQLLPSEGLFKRPDLNRSTGGTDGSSVASPAAGPSLVTAQIFPNTEDEFSISMSAGAVVLHRPNAKPQLALVNALLTLVVMTLLVAGIVPSPVVFLMAVALALVINFPRVAEQSEQIKSHASSIVGVVGMVFAATVLTGVLSGSGMVAAMAKWLVTVIPPSWGPHLAVVTGLISIPMTFFTSNDAFYFGVLPILSETASHYGITPVEMARAALVGQPLHQSSPLVASFLLLVGLAKVELGEHMKKTIWRAIVVGLVMLTVGALTQAFPL